IPTLRKIHRVLSRRAESGSARHLADLSVAGLGGASRRWSVQLGVHEIALTGDAAIAATTLPDFHGDPADRVIVASAQALDAGLVTANDRVLRWPGPLVR